MEEKDKWIKNLRHRMEDYSEPAPADLWNQLEKELNSTPKIIPLWRRWQAVAAIALLVVISTVTVWFWHSPSAEYVERKSVEIASLSPSADMNEIIPTHPSVAHIAPEITSVKKKVNNVEAVMQKAVSAFYNEVMTEKQQKRSRWRKQIRRIKEQRNGTGEEWRACAETGCKNCPA